MAPITITDRTGKILKRLHNRGERRKYEKERGVKIKPAKPGQVRLRPRTRALPIRHVTSRTPAGGSGPSELALERHANRVAAIYAEVGE